MPKPRPHPKDFLAWHRSLEKGLPHLSKPFVAVLALYSFGMLLAQRCSLSSIFPFLAQLFASKENSVRQRLRDFYKDAPHKTGAKAGRRALDVVTCFAPLLRWVVALWQGQQLALALDATLLGDRIAVLSLCVLYRGGAIPVAWAVLPANVKGAWRPHCQY